MPDSYADRYASAFSRSETGNISAYDFVISTNSSAACPAVKFPMRNNNERLLNFVNIRRCNFYFSRNNKLFSTPMQIVAIADKIADMYPLSCAPKKTAPLEQIIVNTVVSIYDDIEIACHRFWNF